MFSVVMRTPRKRFRAITGAVTLCAAVALAAVPSAIAGDDGDSPRAVVSGPSKTEQAAPKVPKARFAGKIESCVESTAYASRGVGVYAAMRPYRGTKKMRMRVHLLRKFPGQPAFSKVTGLGLGEWMSLSPRASVSIRHIAISNVDTDATYRARIDFRWTGKRGKKIAAKSRTATGRCVLTTPTADLQATDLRVTGGVPPVTNYEATVSNVGGSEALLAAWEVRVDGKVVATNTFDSMLAGAVSTFPVNAASCNQIVELVVDPSNTVREYNEANNTRQLGCGPTGG
jgi:hypothetical protein